MWALKLFAAFVLLLLCSVAAFYLLLTGMIFWIFGFWFWWLLPTGALALMWCGYKLPDWMLV